MLVQQLSIKYFIKIIIVVSQYCHKTYLLSYIFTSVCITEDVRSKFINTDCIRHTIRRSLRKNIDVSITIVYCILRNLYDHL